MREIVTLICKQCMCSDEPHGVERTDEGWVRTCLRCGATTLLVPKKGRPTKQETQLMEAWEDTFAVLNTLLEDAKDDYDQKRPVSRSLLRQIELALDTVRRQRSALFRQGRLFEGGDG